MREKVIGILAAVSVIVLLWMAVFVGYSKYLDDKVDGMDSAVPISEETDDGVEEVFVILEDGEHGLDSLPGVLPTVVDVRVKYRDGADETKHAYVSYEDGLKEVKYEDGDYGRIICPAEMNTQPSGKKKEEK